MLCMLLSHLGGATNIKIENVEYRYEPNTAMIPFEAIITLSWDNAWNNQLNYDAAWVFFKVKDNSGTSLHRHVKVLPTGHALIHTFGSAEIAPAFHVPKDSTGIFVFPSTRFRGDVKWRIKVSLDKSVINMSRVTFLQAFGIEMVSIPSGKFYIGDSDSLAHKRGSFYEYFSKRHFLVEREQQQIQVSQEKGSLFYENSNTPHYRGDQRGVIMPEFPKGV
jgi:hypothetical protein